LILGANTVTEKMNRPLGMRPLNEKTTIEQTKNKEGVNINPYKAQTDDTQQDPTTLSGDYGQEESVANNAKDEGAEAGTEQLQGNYGQDSKPAGDAASRFADFKNEQINNGSLKG
jgi:hypothetical protein